MTLPPEVGPAMAPPVGFVGSGLGSSLAGSDGFESPDGLFWSAGSGSSPVMDGSVWVPSLTLEG